MRRSGSAGSTRSCARPRRRSPPGTRRATGRSPGPSGPGGWTTPDEPPPTPSPTRGRSARPISRSKRARLLTSPRGGTIRAPSLCTRRRSPAARRTNQVWLLTSLHAGLAQFQATQGHTPQALDSARQAIELTESVRGQLQEAEMRSSFFEGKQELYQIRLALSLNQLAEGF